MLLLLLLLLLLQVPLLGHADVSTVLEQMGVTNAAEVGSRK